MDLVFQSSDDLHTAWSPLQQALLNSRFAAEFIYVRCRTLRFSKIRLRDRKLYCGNHPKSCEVGNHREVKTAYLEGADWVEFNDMLNNVLDDLDMPCRITSAACVIRKGLLRRIRYDATAPPALGQNWQWDRSGLSWHFADHTQTKDRPESWFPEGTPGQYGDRYAVVG